MKRKIVLCLLGVMGICSCGAQTWAEWTEQKRTQLKYLANAIAANKVYIDYAKKGYAIVSGGLETIQSIKDGDFRLHHLFFDELQRVNPVIKSWGIAMQLSLLLADIIKMIANIEQFSREDEMLNEDERRYALQFCRGMRKRCSDGVERFVDLLTDGSLSMSDAERINAIQRLSHDAGEWRVAVNEFAAEIKSLTIQRRIGMNDIDYSEILRQ